MSKIEWTEQTYNPIIGCNKVSPGCDNCYAETMANRLSSIAIKQYDIDTDDAEFDKGIGAYASVVNSKGKWNNRTMFVENAINKPLKRKKPTMYFVCSMGDLFHESVPFEWIDKVFAVMACSPQHTFQVLTKRPERMKEYFDRQNTIARIMTECDILGEEERYFDRACLAASALCQSQILTNLWLGVTAENQEQANKRIPILLQIPAAIRFVSVEPMLGAVDLTHGWECENEIAINYLTGVWMNDPRDDDPSTGNKLDWVICGGESGHKARPLHPDWVRSLRNQCEDSDTPFFLKQWGEWYTTWVKINTSEHTFKFYYSYLQFTQKLWVGKGDVCLDMNGKICKHGGDMQTAEYPVTIMSKVGKKKAGSLLDGKEYKQFPKT